MLTHPAFFFFVFFKSFCADPTEPPVFAASDLSVRIPINIDVGTTVATVEATSNADGQEVCAGGRVRACLAKHQMTV